MTARARHVVVASFTAETQHQRRTVPTDAELFTLYVRRRRRLTKGTPGRSHVAGVEAGMNTEASIDALFGRLSRLIANPLQIEIKSYSGYRVPNSTYHHHHHYYPRISSRHKS